MPKKLRGKCFRGRQQHSEQVHAGLLNAYHQDCSDHACHARISASPPTAAVRRTGLPSGGRWWAGADACMTCMVQSVLMTRVHQARVHLLRLPLSATKVFSAKLLRHRVCRFVLFVTKRRTLKEAKVKMEELKCVVNSNLASKPRNSFFWTSCASSSARPWDPKISVGPYKMSSAVYLRPILRCCKSIRALRSWRGNHVKYLRAGPAEMPFQTWYTVNRNHFLLTDFCQTEIKNITGLSNKPSTASSCAEDQILENTISGTGF